MLTALQFLVGLLLLVGGAEAVVRGAARLAVVIGVSPLVVGLTVVAAGTSSPELAVTVQAAFSGEADIALGNVVGSNIANVLLILGLSAVTAPLVVSQRLVRLDVPLMIGTSVLLFILAANGHLNRWEGILLVAGIAAYTVFAIRQSRREDEVVRHEYEDFTAAAARGRPRIIIQLVLIAGGLICLTLGSRWLVSSAVHFAALLGLSELVIALTIVAGGTSLPEAATSVIATLRGQRDIAVGNVVGSNLFNILLVLGVGCLVAPGGIPVSRAVFTFDIPIMIAVAVACLPVFFTGNRIDRWEGLLFLTYYVAYVLYLILRAREHDALATFGMALVTFVIPLMAVTVAILVARARVSMADG